MTSTRNLSSPGRLINWSIVQRLVRTRIRDNALTLILSIVIPAIVAGIAYLVVVIRGIDSTDFSFVLSPHIEVNGGDATWLVAFLVLGMVIAIVSFITGIVDAATTRTYLGSGMTRKSSFATFTTIWILNAVFLALLTLVIGVVVMTVYGDFSGNLVVSSLADPTADTSIIGLEAGDFTGTILQHALWLAPLLAFLVSLTVTWVGYGSSILFVRFTWWIPVGGFILLNTVVPWAARRIGLPSIDSIPWPSSSNMMVDLLYLASQYLLVALVCGGALIALSLWRLPIRR